MPETKTNRSLLTVLMFIISLVFCLPAWTDIITLKNGEQLEGVISARSPDSILIKTTGSGLLSIDRSTIEKIERKKLEYQQTASGIEAEVEFLSCGEYLTALKRELKAAEKSIYVMMFYVNYNDRNSRHPATELSNLLVRAHLKGIKVKVLLEESSAENITKANQNAAEYLSSNGIEVRFFPVYPIMHTKLVIIDEQIIILGSHNWTQSAIQSNIESSVLIESKNAAKKYLNYFNSTFRVAKVYHNEK